ncbi:hypothetical protein NDU88_001055 [Pleurodeles waltl]|uniref:Uncharacterized protein n=1 Tax=Pleurodeles waltl TaxID=8319 RepID=A0AAV7S6B2_PLEWA|nr:hypothetical protein NDU88_001055 [Pleurodeles waltl]
MAPLRPSEIVAELKDMQGGKAMGMGGLTVVFYKTYQDNLVHHLVSFFEKMVKDGCLPPMMREALLVTLIKPAAAQHSVSDLAFPDGAPGVGWCSTSQLGYFVMACVMIPAAHGAIRTEPELYMWHGIHLEYSATGSR